MDRRWRRRGLALLLLLLVPVVVQFAWRMASDVDHDEGRPGLADRLRRGGSAARAHAAGEAADPGGLHISGDLRGVHPGFDGALELTVHNDHPFEVVVRDLAVDVGEPTGSVPADPDDPGCRAAHLEVGAPTRRPAVPAGASATVALAARMPLDAPDACQRAAFRLHYTATVTRVALP